MNDKKSFILGLIPARGGSKGIKNKNIKKVNGKPLIAHAIECGRNCRSIDQLIVSTDSEEIARVARQFGADVPFMRPASLANDSSPMLPVMQHAILESEKHFCAKVEILVLLDPTGPLRIVDDIEKALALLRDADCDAVISGNDAHRNPYFNMVKKSSGFVDLVLKEHKAIGRRQDAPEVFDLNTVVWAYTRKALMDEKARIPRKTLLYKVPTDRAIDIDTEFDFQLLEYLMSHR
jgi:CMP-N-acetylneuraminic acid synthetase